MDKKLIFLLQTVLEILIMDYHPVMLDAEQLQDKWQNSLVNDTNHIIFVKNPHNINIMKFHLLVLNICLLLLSSNHLLSS